MKKITTLILMLFTINLFANEQIFENSKIERKLKNGKTQKFDGNEYMIVKRGVKRKPIVVTKTTVVEVERVKKVYKKNAVKLFLGHGPSDLSVQNNSVSLEKEPFLGVGYQRMLNESFSIELIGTTNESIMLGGGYHF